MANGIFYDGLNSNLLISASAVGIGNTSPSETLTVEGSISASGDLYLGGAMTLGGDLTIDGIVTAREFHTEFVSGSIIYQSGSTKFGDSSDDIHSITGSLQASGSDSYFLGNVGIGTTSPAEELHVVGDGRFEGSSYSMSILNGSDLRGSNQLLLRADNSYLRLQAGNNNIYHQAGASHIFQDVSQNTLAIITQAGNVGIGTTSPGSKLHVEGDVRIGSNKLKLGAGNADSYIQHDGSNLITFFQSNWGGDFKFRAADTSGTQHDILFIEGSNQSVGIGVTSPAEKLDVVGNVKIKGNADFYNTSNQLYGRVYSDSEGLSFDTVSNRHTRFHKQGIETMRIDTSGNVGIGTTSPLYKLDVVGSARIDGVLRVGTTLQQGEIKIIDSNGTTFSLTSGVVANHKFAIEETSTNTRYLVIDGATGNVGIGTTSPTYKLQVTGSFKAQGSDPYSYIEVTGQDVNIDANSDITIGSNATDSVTIGAATGETRPTTIKGGPIYLQTTNLTRMFIDQDGDIGIGTTSPAEKLDVIGNIKSSGGIYVGGSNSFLWNNDAGSNLRFGTAGSEKMRITSNGNVGIGTTNPSQKLEVAGTINQTALGSAPSDDLDNLDSTRFFKTHTATTNVPAAITSFGMGWTIAYTTDNTVQFLTNRNSNDPIYFRKQANGSYSSWKRLRDENQITDTDITNWDTGYLNWSGQTYSDLNLASSSNQFIKAHVGATNFPDDPYFAQTSPSFLSGITALYGVGNGWQLMSDRSTTKTLGYRKVINGNWGTWKYLWSTDHFTTSSVNNWNTAYSWGDHAGLYVDGSGTANYIPKWTDSDTISNSIIYDNGSKIGIGTTNPLTKLEIKGTGALDGEVRINSSADDTSFGIFRFVGDASTYEKYLIGYNSNHATQPDQLSLKNQGGHITFFTGTVGSSSEQMRITTAGNVGIGTTVPAAKFHVKGTGTSNTTKALVVENADNSAYLQVLDNGNINQKVAGFLATSFGTDAAKAITTAPYYSAFGNSAGLSSTTGGYWTAIGAQAGRSSTTGQYWTALGFFAGHSNVGGSNWVALGASAGEKNTSGNNWIAIGNSSARYYSGGTTNADSFTNGVYIGTTTKVGGAGAQNEIVIGHEAEGIGSNSVVLGNDSITTTALKGNVGIGTTSPSQKLEIADSDPRIRITDTDGTNWESELFTQGGALKLQSRNGANFGNISFQGDNGTTQLEYARFNSVGNLGIGTTSPDSKLEVAGSVHISGNNTTRLDLDSNVKITGHYNGNNNNELTYLNMYNSGNASINMGTKHSLGYISFESGNGSYVERMRITNTGNIGIGTTAPSQKLEVVGHTILSGSMTLKDSTGIRLYDSGGFGGGRIYGSYGMYNGEIIIQPGNTGARSVFSRNGSLTIGGQNSFAGDYYVGNILAPDHGLVVSGSVGVGTKVPRDQFEISQHNSTSALRISGFDTNSSENYRIYIGSDGSSNIRSTSYIRAIADSYYYDLNSGGAFRVRNDASSEILHVNNNGNVGIGTNNPTQKLTVDGNIFPNQDNVFQLGGSGKRWSSVYVGTITNYGDAQIDGDLTVGGKVTAQEFHTEFVSASIIYQSGSTKFGNSSDDVHSFTGSVSINDGILTINGDTHSRIFLQNPGGSGDSFIAWYDSNANYDWYFGQTSENSAITLYNYTQAGTHIQFNNNGETYLPLGNVGIGTTSPSQKLDVAGNIALSTAGYIYGDTTTPSIRLTNAGGATLNYGTSTLINGGSLQFNVGAIVRFRISSGGGGYVNSGNFGFGTTSPSYNLDVAGGIRAGGKITYTKTYSSLDTTGNAVAGLESATNGQSSLFTFTCFGHTGGYQKIVYSCYNVNGTWNTKKVIDEGTNDFDIEASANGTTITFTFKSTSGTKAYVPKVIVEAAGSAINSTYA